MIFSRYFLRGSALLACLLLFTLFACQKDPSELFPNQVDSAFSATPNYPVSLAEAITYFGEFQSIAVSNLDAFTFIKMEPKWDEASIGYSLSGKEIITVPLPDSAFQQLNQGRTGAKLLFSKSGPDSVTADLVVYVADSAYYQATNGVLEFSTFTGAYVYFDLSQQFRYAISVDSGAVVGGTDTILPLLL